MASKSTKATAPEPTEAPAEQQDHITLVGRLVADPELRFTKTTGKPVTNLRIAVNDGDKPVEFHRVTVWGRSAEVVAQYKRKGHRLEITGRVQERSYQDADGVERQSTEVIAHNVQFLGREPKAEQDEREVA